MNRFFCLLLSLMLCGCFASGRRGGDVAMTIHDFGLVDRPPLVSERSRAMGVAVRAPAWLDSMAIDYRLAYQDGGSVLRQYSRARWAASPAQLVQQRLARALDMQSLGRTRCMLRLELSEFSQVFDTLVSSRGVLRGRAEVLDTARRKIAEREIFIDIAAPSADSAGAVIALSGAVDELVLVMDRWLKAGDGGASTAGCLI